MTSVTINTDGASRGNPGDASIAYVIKGLEEAPIEFHQAIGIYSNNQAEYRAFLAALEKLVALDVRDTEIEFRADSELMIKQIRGEYRVKDQFLQPLYQQAQELIQALRARGNRPTFTAVRREQNQEADRLANLALDEQ